MKQRYLLDCTLRDGGYINDWEFGHDNIINIFERVVNAGIDAIEIGFLDDRRTFDINRTIMPDTDSARKIFGKLDRAKTLTLGMIDFGTCKIENLQPCKDSWLDGIRVIFKKEKMQPAMEFCRQVKSLGYKVFAQLVSVGSYSDSDIYQIISLANDINPYALSMVDTYGLLGPKELRHIMEILDENLNSDIILGFHAHNNFQLGYINAVTVLDYNTDRDILVDGTLYGMGKSAGNAPIELIAMHMNEHHGKSYVISELQEAIITSIVDFQKISPWGYQLFYYIAASNKVHPNYVSYLMNKRTLSITAVNEILKKIPLTEKLEKNMNLIEQLYFDYQQNECDDTQAIKNLQHEITGHEVLIIGPAPSIKTHTQEIVKYINDKKPLVIAINYIPGICKPDYMFITNNTRFLQSVTKLHEDENNGIKLIASSNLTKNGQSFDFVINYSSVIDSNADIPDNSMCMLIRTLIKCGCRDTVLAGLDGYTPDNVNYYDVSKEYSFLRGKAESLNNYARDFFDSVAEKIHVSFLTPSLYQRR